MDRDVYRRLEVGEARNDLHEPKGEPIGVDSVIVRRAVIDLSTARTTQPLELAGRFLWAATSVLNTANVDVYLNDTSGDPINFRRGHSLKGKRVGFHRLYISNAAQPGASITLHASVSPDIDITNASVDTSITQVQPNNHLHGVNTIGGTATAIGSGTTTGLVRQRIIADAANTGLLYVGRDATLTTANGYGPLGPTDQFLIDTSVPLFVIATVAAQAYRYVDSFIQ